MINGTLKPIVFKYFLWYLLVRVRQRMIPIYKTIQNRGLVLHSELFVDTSLEVYSENNPCVSISQSTEKNWIRGGGLFDHR